MSTCIFLILAATVNSVATNSDSAPAIAEKDSKIIAQTMTNNNYLLTIKSRPTYFIIYSRQYGICYPWMLYEIDVTDRTTNQTYRAWSVYYPTTHSKPLASFCIGQRDHYRVGVAYLGPLGDTLGFYEIDLTKETEVADTGIPNFRMKPHQRPPGFTYTFPQGTPSIFEPSHHVLIGGYYVEAFGDYLEDVLKKEKPRISKVEWVDNQWVVTVVLAKKSFVLSQSGNQGSWKAITLPDASR